MDTEPPQGMCRTAVELMPFGNPKRMTHGHDAAIRASVSYHRISPVDVTYTNGTLRAESAEQVKQRLHRDPSESIRQLKAPQLLRYEWADVRSALKAARARWERSC